MVNPTAPYRFITLNRDVVASPVQEPRHDEPLRGGLSGSIEVEWEAQGPLLIGDPRNDNGAERVLPLVLVPTADAGKTAIARTGVIRDACIPGATLRGMVKAVFEIATFSKLKPINASYRFGYRDFHNSEYKTALLDDEDQVFAGWLERGDDGKFYLRCCHWRRIEITTPRAQGGLGQGADWLKMNLGEKYAALGYVGQPSEGASFVWRNERTLLHDGTKYHASVVCSGRTPGGNKQFEYVFFDAVDYEDRVEIPTEIFQDFNRVHGAPRADGSYAPAENWAVLHANLEPAVPQALRRIPVFYVGDPHDPFSETNRLRLGLTRLFKLGHRFDVGDLVPDAHRDTTVLDFTEALFGYVEKKAPQGDREPETLALKSRVAFGFATLTEESKPWATVSQEYRAVLMTPRASFEPFYLTGDRRSYNAADADGRPIARLAGRKRYPARLAADDRTMRTTAATAKANVISRLHYLTSCDSNQKLKFCSRIRYQNLHPVELGALLWAVTLGNDPTRRHMVGRAKPYGFGALKVKVLDCPPNDMAQLLTAFSTYMTNELGKTWLDTIEVKRLLDLTNPAWGTMQARGGNLAYLPGPEAHSEVRRNGLTLP